MAIESGWWSRRSPWPRSDDRTHSIHAPARFIPGRALLFAVLAAAGCGGAGDPTAGGRVFRESMCVKCHGERREGTEFAPALKGLAGRWREEDLVEYFLDPPKWVAKDPRLKELAGRYPALMPRFVMDDDVRRDLARYLLVSED